MEEKLYFRPADYGKGSTKAKSKSDSPKRFLKIGLILFAIAVIVLLVFYLLHGNTVTTNEKIPSVKSTALSCSSNSFVYPIFTYDGAKSRELNVKMIFSDDELKSIALDYSLFYDSADVINGSEAHNHASMNISFSKSGLKADAYDAKYTILSDRVRMNLYATTAKLDEVAKPYFLISGDGNFPIFVQKLRENYESQGFACEFSE